MSIFLLLRRRAIAKQSGGGGILPSGYTQYDWIQCNDELNTSYIDVDLKPNLSTGWVFTGSFARTATYTKSYDGLWIFTKNIGGGYACNYGIGRYANTNSGELAFNYNGRTNQSSFAGSPTTIAAIGGWHTFELGPTEGVSYGGTLVLDSTDSKSYSAGSKPNSSAESIKLLCGIPCRMGIFKAYKNNVLIAELIPAVRDTDNVAGMYDVVRNTFYEPTGESTFVCGNGLEDFTV